jgi:tRNA threonylcarbamoyladenosine biosynthesis protein TsaE
MTDERPVLHRELTTADDTLAFGAQLGGVLRAGDLVVLSGPLGAGKTTLTKGIAVGMGISGVVNSPTFVIARVHRPDPPHTVPLIHVDAYRLGSPAEVEDLDLDLDRSAVVVEWGEGKAEELSADGYLHVELLRRPDDSRAATLSASGQRWLDALADLRA